jgi:hypothetical protein
MVQPFHWHRSKYIQVPMQTFVDTCFQVSVGPEYLFITLFYHLQFSAKLSLKMASMHGHHVSVRVPGSQLSAIHRCFSGGSEHSETVARRPSFYCKTLLFVYNAELLLCNAGLYKPLYYWAVYQLCVHCCRVIIFLFISFYCFCFLSLISYCGILVGWLMSNMTCCCFRIFQCTLGAKSPVYTVITAITGASPKPGNGEVCTSWTPGVKFLLHYLSFEYRWLI